MSRQVFYYGSLQSSLMLIGLAFSGSTCIH
uniref:Uncharacterized protein n=1 Tax=Arundo donax TaxID=35708 RepID=A0A0A8YF99_ARUDO